MKWTWLSIGAGGLLLPLAWLVVEHTGAGGAPAAAVEESPAPPPPEALDSAPISTDPANLAGPPGAPGTELSLDPDPAVPFQVLGEPADRRQEQVLYRPFSRALRPIPQRPTATVQP